MDQAADQACELLKALASPTRLKILCHLIDGEKSVGQIAEAVGARDTSVSQHLALLRKDKVVRARRSGQTIYYAIENPAAERILRVLHDIFCGKAAANGGAPATLDQSRPEQV
ncbi:MAG: metalloregulator ArsR/SmtB family transcription factor [Azospirillum sp.]|nr:metalloregulator ArsR/SmtB family transcription factor [Azospirillum sp.]